MADKKRAENTFKLAEALVALYELQDISARMDDWLQEFLLANPNAIPTAAYPQTLNFSTVRSAITTLLYWAIKSILSYFVDLVATNLLIHQPQSRSIPNIWGSLSVGQVLDLHTETICVEYCTNIVRTMGYILRDDMGLMAAQQAIFPIRVALFYMKRRGGEELKWCQDLYNQVIEKKGLRYAEALSQSDGGYGRDRKIVEEVNRSCRLENDGANVEQ